MRILHVLDHSIPLHSGYAFRTRAVLTEQRALGWEVTCVTSARHNVTAGEVGETESVEGFMFYRSRDVGGWGRRIPGLDPMRVVGALERRIEEVVEENRPDVLHAHSPALNGEAAVRVGRRMGLPVVYEVRAFWEDAAVDHGTAREGGIRYRLTRALETRVLRRADAVVTICDGLRRAIGTRGVPDERMTVVPNAVDDEQFRYVHEPDSRLAESLGLHEAVVLGFAGSFYQYEGLTLLLEALPTILDHDPAVRVLLVGGGPQEELLRRRAHELGVSTHVVFTGRVPHGQVARYYDLVDVFVYPRLSMPLTELVTPLKPLEAMAGGRLVVASDVGGHRELIEPGVTGELFRAGDPQALTEKVISVLDNRHRWERYREAARRFVETERTWRASAARYRKVYESVVSATNRGSQPARSRSV